MYLDLESVKIACELHRARLQLIQRCDQATCIANAIADINLIVVTGLGYLYIDSYELVLVPTYVVLRVPGTDLKCTFKFRNFSGGRQKHTGTL